MRKSFLTTIFLCLICLVSAADEPLRFVAIGDMGCGCPGQRGIADKMLEWYQNNPFGFVLTTGDNIYGDPYSRFWNRRRGGNKALFQDKFDAYYNPLRNRGVSFFATLGNHDLETREGKDLIEDRKRFNILSDTGYYYFSPDPKLVTFVALNTETLYQDKQRVQLKWLQKVLSESKSTWKIVYTHHPLYTAPGSHPGSIGLRDMLEPILVRNGVKIFIAGHNHFYSRMKPQFGIIHFTTGGGGRNLKIPRKSSQTDAVGHGFHFVYFELTAEKLTYRVITIRGPMLDEGEVVR